MHPNGFFKTDSELGTAVGIENAIDALAALGSVAAIDALINLLAAPFGRDQASYMDDAGLHRVVAAHLIDLTGESFGTDATAWRSWFQNRRAIGK